MGAAVTFQSVINNIRKDQPLTEQSYK